MTHEHHDPSPADLVIIGGGPAGMSAALMAGRGRLATVIISAESPRNAVTTASHGFLTRDGAHPSELLAASKDQLTKYKSVSYADGTVTAATRAADGFEVTLAGGRRITTNRLVIATGHVDDLDSLGLPGIKDIYGSSAYPCVFCDGFEHRDQRLALIGREGAINYAPMVRLWSDDLMVFTNGANLGPADAALLEANHVEVHTEPIRRLESEDGQLRAVVLDTGQRIERDVCFISEEYSRPATTLAQELGVTSSPNDWGGSSLDADNTGRSAIDGLYVVGDARTGFSGLIAAAAEGAACAEMIAHEIAAERWSHPVTT